MNERVALALHGGAGSLSGVVAGSEAERQMRRELQGALELGAEVLLSGGSALDAVVRTVESLEDCPLFNAGRGSVLRSDGHPRLDASAMCGSTRHAGAVAGVRRVRNPIRLARRLLDAAGPVLLIGEEAERRAVAEGLELEGEEYFVTEQRQAQWQLAARSGRISLDHDEEEQEESEAAVAARGGGEPGETVGAVALDARGNLAAATSTGGLTNADPGRVGDSPIIGAGTFADDETCAVSATGTGEAFLRCAFAHAVHLRRRLLRMGLGEAVRQALDDVVALGGRGGCVAVDREGHLALPFDTPAMPRASLDPSGRRRIEIGRGVAAPGRP